MSSFLYFLSNRDAGLSPEEIKAAGLGYALAGPVHQQHLTGNGPGGVGGTLLASADHCDASRVRYVPAEQEWIETANGWLGRWKADTIGPRDLLQPKPLDGHFVELADGNRWLCPVARTHGIEGSAIRWYHALPQTVAIGPDRKWKPGDVVPRYRRLWALNEAWWDVQLAVAYRSAGIGDTITFDFEGLYSSAAECLAVNYRLGPDEISLLGLFDSDSARKILDALIDVPSVVALSAELEKKTDSIPPVG